MSFILSISFSTFLQKNYTANHRSFQCFFVVYVLYIITNVFAHFYLKIIPRIIAVSNSFFVEYVLYIINEFLLPFTPIEYRSLPCLSALFSKKNAPILSIDFCTFKADMTPFLMPVHTYSLIIHSSQIRASIFDTNSV